jgi:uncharacterized protein HemX
MTDTPPTADVSTQILATLEQQNALLEKVNTTVGEIRPQVDTAIETQRRASRRTLAALVVAVLLFVGSAGCVVWQRQNQANHERITACRSTNDARAVSRTAWAVVWDAIDKAATPDQRAQIDTVRADQRDAYAPLPCK